eukprot:5164848-Pleurochrysis_carterae.AAC.1
MGRYIFREVREKRGSGWECEEQQRSGGGITCEEESSGVETQDRVMVRSFKGRGGELARVLSHGQVGLRERRKEAFWAERDEDAPLAWTEATPGGDSGSSLCVPRDAAVALVSGLQQQTQTVATRRRKRSDHARA